MNQKKKEEEQEWDLIWLGERRKGTRRKSCLETDQDWVVNAGANLTILSSFLGWSLEFETGQKNERRKKNTNSGNIHREMILDDSRMSESTEQGLHGVFHGLWATDMRNNGTVDSLISRLDSLTRWSLGLGADTHSLNKGIPSFPPSTVQPMTPSEAQTRLLLQTTDNPRRHWTPHLVLCFDIRYPRGARGCDFGVMRD